MGVRVKFDWDDYWEPVRPLFRIKVCGSAFFPLVVENRSLVNGVFNTGLQLTRGEWAVDVWRSPRA